MKSRRNDHVRDYAPETLTNEEKRIWELIHQRRRQILVHSTLYYRLDKSIISDNQFDSWAYELAELQRANPEISRKVEFHRRAFEGFDGTTGFDLPIEDPYALRKALELLEL